MVRCGIGVTGIVIQTATPQPKSWKRTLEKTLGAELSLRLVSLRWTAETRRLFFVERRLEQAAQRRLQAYLGDASREFPPVPILRTANVNSDEAYALISKHAPDLLVVYATGLLKKRTIEAAPLGALNPHTAILPDYRGAGAEFWQLYHEAYDKTGITIHFIDEGVDTGDVVYECRVAVPAGTDPFMLRALNTIQIVQDYPSVVQRVLSGRIVRRPQPPTSTPCFRARDLTDAHKRELFQRLGLFRPGSARAEVGFRLAQLMSRLRSRRTSGNGRSYQEEGAAPPLRAARSKVWMPNRETE
jgi:folate-dependent phosphoribosylglycinamide formyltransferase PurN